ncbi:hypothetical protein [Bradyrhizobium sp. RDM4]|uniref:hypothetical protein n=1 Tax=Bradyrhizobium sp. RDM4 TaxID=3378765 RepID=UPI0038FCB462
MLTRPPARARGRTGTAVPVLDSDDADRAHLDKLAADKRFYRRLIAGGGAVLKGVPVTDIDALIEAVVDLDWLPEETSEDRKALLAAVGAMIDDIAKPYRRAKSCPVRTDRPRKPRL